MTHSGERKHSLRQAFDRYRQALRCDGLSLPYSGMSHVDALTRQALAKVEEARYLLERAAEELDP